MSRDSSVIQVEKKSKDFRVRKVFPIKSILKNFLQT